MEETLKKKYAKRLRKIVESELRLKNKIAAVAFLAVPELR
jgi:hypothetical protein